MSSYLIFRKNKVVICSFSRNTHIYQAFECVPFADWESVSRERLRDGLDNLRSEMEEKEKQIKIYQKMLTAKMEYEDVFSTANSIIENEQDLEAIKRAICYLELIIQIEQEGNYNNQSPLEWCIG